MPCSSQEINLSKFIPSVFNPLTAGSVLITIWSFYAPFKGNLEAQASVVLPFGVTPNFPCSREFLKICLKYPSGSALRGCDTFWNDMHECLYEAFQNLQFLRKSVQNWRRTGHQMLWFKTLCPNFCILVLSELPLVCGMCRKGCFVALHWDQNHVNRIKIEWGMS